MFKYLEPVKAGDKKWVRAAFTDGFIDLDEETEATVNREIKWAKAHLPESEVNSYITYCFEEGSLSGWHDSEAYAEMCSFLS